MALNKKTGAKKVLLTAPVKGFMSVGGDIAQTLSEDKKTHTLYKLANGEAHLFDPKKEKRKPSPQKKKIPKVEVIADTAAVSKEGLLNLFFRLPVSKPEKKQR